MGKKPNLSPADRLRIISKHEAGVTTAELCAEFGCARNTIHYTIKRHSTHGTIKDLPRTGRPPKLSVHEKKIVCRKARAAPKIEYSELAKASTFVNADGTPSTPPSRSTLYRCLKGYRLRNFRCKLRPKLNKVHALKRLQFCKEYRHFRWARRTLKFTDECSVQKGSGHNTEWCFRYDEEKWRREMITEVRTSRVPAQMVLASVWLDERGEPRRSPLVIMERDSDAPKGGYTSKSYIQALTEGLLPHWRRSQLFMQDNARIHTSKTTKRFLEQPHITPITWPAYSPDLNPIEHL